MSHQPSDGVQSPPFTRETSPDDAVFEETSLAEAAATALPSMKPPSSHSPEANTVPNSVERPHAPGVAPHVLPVTSKSLPASSSEISSRTTRHGEPSQASGKTTSQQKKRKYHLISREDDDDIKPYSFGKEPPRKKEIDHPSFKEAERAARRIPAEMISIIDRSLVKHGDIDFIKDMAVAAMSPKATAGVKLGLRGDSGVGKSSVINSLLDVPNLAPQGDAGKACTSVVHEYHKPRVNQGNACEAEILFHTAPTRVKILKEWVECSSTSHHSSVQLGDDHLEEEEKASETAIHGLFSLFCDRDECQDPDSIKKFVSTSKSEDYDGLILKLTAWTEELLNKFKIVSEKVSITEDTPQKMQAQICRYTRHQKARDINGRLIPSPWPFVDVARVFHDRPILSDDVILVDLPGTQDTNQFRVQTAMRYLNDVDYIGVVARSDRLQTDDNVRTYLRDAFRRKHRASTLVIATSSDSVDMSPTSLDEKIDTADPIHKRNLTTLRERLHAITVKHQETTCNLKKSNILQDQAHWPELFNQLGELESRKRYLEDRLFEYCVEMRNEDTSQSIRQNYYNWTNDPVPLPVFCVSNLVYAKCISNNEHPPMMDINNTNIPALRAFLHALPAFRKFKAFEHHHENVLPSLLNHLDITCSQTKIDGREELHKILFSASEGVAGDVRESFKSFFDEAILPGIAIIKTNKAAYATYATDKLTKWSYWHNQTYKTFCIHRGNWRTQKVGRRDWNEEMLELLVQDIDRETNGWEDAMGGLSKNITAKLDARVTKLIPELHGVDGSPTASMKLFVLELQRKQALLGESCRARAKKIQRDLIAVKERITDTQDMEESYFVRSLEKTYDDCSRMSGDGCHAGRAEALRSKISHKVRDPFSEMFDLANKDAQKVIQRHEKKFTQEVTDVFESLNRTFAHGFMTEGADTTEVKQLRETLRAKIPHWRGILTGKINRHLEDCREYAKSG